MFVYTLVCYTNIVVFLTAISIRIGLLFPLHCVTFLPVVHTEEEQVEDLYAVTLFYCLMKISQLLAWKKWTPFF